MRKAALALVASALLATAALGLPTPAQAAPSSHAVVNDDGFRFHHRFGHRFGRFGFGFPVVTPFFGGGFGFNNFGFNSFGGGCEIFLEIGDINSYVLCRVG